MDDILPGTRRKFMDEQELTKQGQKDEQVAGKLLSLDEQEVCEQLAAGEVPYSQRAQALLAIDVGATQTQAAQRAGLTNGQVKYWLGKFRQVRMDVFPEAVLKDAEMVLVSLKPESSEEDVQTTKSSGKSKKSKGAKEPTDKESKGSKKKKAKKFKDKKESKKKKGKKSKKEKGKNQDKKKGTKKKKKKTK